MTNPNYQRKIDNDDKYRRKGKKKKKIKDDKFALFLSALAEISTKYDVAVAACDCCGPTLIDGRLKTGEKVTYESNDNYLYLMPKNVKDTP
ncbi:MAG: hypothetical protein Q8O94_03080 [bacterium]|nr:hypothetical protein [bacterium]